MTTDNKTLADVQPGGRVRLGDQAERARFEAFLSANPLKALCAGTAWEVWQAALSAQPSPGGQGEARAIIEEFVQCATLGRPHGKLIAQAKDYLAARQPVGEPVGQVRTRVDGGFIAELLPGVSDRVSNMAPLYLQQPAQAVDLDAARREGHDCAIRYVLGYLNGTGDLASTQYGEILNGCGRESIIRSAIRDGELEFTGLGRWVAKYGTDAERALIGSQAVGNK